MPRSWHVEGAPLYQEITENALAATGARFVNMSRLDHQEQMLYGAAWATAPDALYHRALDMAQRIVPGILPTGLSFPVSVNPIVRAVHVEGKTILATLEESAKNTVPPELVHIAQTIMGARFTLSVPLWVGGEVAGALAFHFTDEPTEVVQRTAEAFAQQASLSLENARLSASLRERIEELRQSRDRIIASDERIRKEIAELLHSRVQARLVVVSHKVWACQSLIRSDPARAEAVLAELADELDRICEEDVRQASHILHPSIIDVGLVPALYLLAERFEPSFRITIDASPALVALDDPVANRIPEIVRLAAYRVVEEGLGNAARHSGASNVTVSLDAKVTRDQGGLAISVHDDGRGFDAAAARPGLGLRSIDDRVEQLGGTWRIESEPGRGMTLHAVLPLPEG
jgi:signal transduction histidine kinase